MDLWRTPRPRTSKKQGGVWTEKNLDEQSGAVSTMAGWSAWEDALQPWHAGCNAGENGKKRRKSGLGGVWYQSSDSLFLEKMMVLSMCLNPIYASVPATPLMGIPMGRGSKESPPCGVEVVYSIVVVYTVHTCVYSIYSIYIVGI